ncbi:ribose-phosphate pyrophosphokinase 1 [Friedmanniomyces endolithicus]|uniref:Ribose-phosphate pyrophosphokinase 1 n=1 Tax=Friedmanniomyces endolithicus TaxID=329885 RepID=A0AAN6L0X9_9PEZI|nr:ribose-phosphate pyrophosphokinase 1 [Friedmanniomyces endolithicus]KAK0962818.1 ribose-phosphate pyrophosphokinase 1 [Friedmanniomyces endolithicus]KAK1011782.1 ribose-phosphate pyrophosphokinase 1 [Friedmanniomyces endolithicus]KAK1046967.1 ribose-phosphate pyrophosphokinase 1 [Friedmanniomyces endolithicus]
MRQTCIFSGSSHPALVEAICGRLGQKRADVTLGTFSNGETRVEVQTSVRDQDVFIVQSGSSQINDNIMELLIMIQACRGGSSKSITAVMPYFPYSRQSKKKTHRGAITARMLANLMYVAGVNHVITIDLHASQMQGFFKCPVDNLMAEPLLSKWLRMNIPDWPEAVVVSKNPGGTKRVTSMADALKLSFGIVTTDRRRATGMGSMQGSAIFESMGTDGTNDPSALEGDAEDAEGRIRPMTSSREHNFAHQQRQQHAPPSNGDMDGQPRRTSMHRAATAGFSPIVRTRLNTLNGNGDAPASPSPLSRSTRPESVGTASSMSDGVANLSLLRTQTAPGNEQPPHDSDGYEEAEGEDDGDEPARDVITGRLIHGHIVEDDFPSPSLSVRSGSIQGGVGQRGSRSSEDEPLPEPMMQSFMSTTSSRMQAPQHGLGGTGDATASDEEEEEALKDPYIESTVTLVGNVKDRLVLIVDDIIDKAGSWIAAAETVIKRGGATKVYCMATHGLFGGDSLRELDMCEEIEAIVVTDAFPIPEEKRRQTKKLVVLDVSGLLAEAIRRNHHGESISQLYQHFD